MASESERVERRAQPLAELEVVATPRTLRRALRAVDEFLGDIEKGTARRVGLLIGEIIGRRVDGRRGGGEPLRLALKRLPDSVVLEVAAPQLPGPATLRDAPGGGNEAPFPFWALEGLADRWALDRRRGLAAMWFLVAGPGSEERSR